MNEHLSIYDRIKKSAEEGKTHRILNLYMRQVLALVRDGFALQKLGSVSGYPNEYRCHIDWADAAKGTVAHKYLELSLKKSEMMKNL